MSFSVADLARYSAECSRISRSMRRMVTKSRLIHRTSQPILLGLQSLHDRRLALRDFLTYRLHRRRYCTIAGAEILLRPPAGPVK